MTLKYLNIIMAIFIIIYWINLIQTSFLSQYYSVNHIVRVIRNSGPTFAKSYTYKTLAEAIQEGRRLIPSEGERLVHVKKVGHRNLRNLNNIAEYYKGRQALFYLACDLEQAIKEGYIKVTDAKNGIDIQKLGQTLSEEFKKRQGMVDQFLDWQDFFRIKQKLARQKGYSSPAKYKYMWDEGQVKLAVEERMPEVKYLFYAFGYDYGWSFMDFSLQDLEQAKAIFRQDPYYYIENKGLMELAKKANINSLKGLFNSREYLPGYEQTIHNWIKVYPTSKRMEKIKEKFEQNEDRYRKPSGMYELLSELIDENIKSPLAILNVRSILPGYKQGKYRWNIQFLPVDKLNTILRIFRKSPSQYIGNDGLKLLCKKAGMRNYHGVYLAREFLPGYSDKTFGWHITFLTESEQLRILERLDSLKNRWRIDLEGLSYEDKIRLVDQIKLYGEGPVGEFLKTGGKLGAEVLIHSNIPVNTLFDIVHFMEDDYPDFFNLYLEIDKPSKEVSSLYGLDAKGLKSKDRQDSEFIQVLKDLGKEVRGVFYNVNTLILEELSNIVPNERIKLKRKQTFLKAYQDILTILYVLTQYKNDSFQIAHEPILEPGEATQIKFEDSYDGKPLGVFLFLRPINMPSISQPGIRWRINPDTENEIQFLLDKGLDRRDVHINISSSNLEKIYTWAEREEGDHFAIEVPNLWRNFSRVVRIFY